MATDIKHTPGFDSGGWDRGDRLQAGLEPDHSDDPRCPDCGSLEPETRYLMERMDGKGPFECDNAFHGEGL